LSNGRAMDDRAATGLVARQTSMIQVDCEAQRVARVRVGNPPDNAAAMASKI
jgi:hypothetical protein